MALGEMAVFALLAEWRHWQNSLSAESMGEGRNVRKTVAIAQVGHMLKGINRHLNTNSKLFKVIIRFEVPVLRMYWDQQFMDSR